MILFRPDKIQNMYYNFKMDKFFKFWIYVLYGLYYETKNKVVDQLLSYCADHLHLCLANIHKNIFHDAAHPFLTFENFTFFQVKDSFRFCNGFCHLEPALQFPAHLDCYMYFMSTCFEYFLEVEMT